MAKLYRGVSKSLDKSLGGKLVPKGGKSEVSTRYGDGSRYGQITYGKSEVNTVRAHQMESSMYDGCFISTTRNLSEAKKFATSGNMEDGYVYVIDESLIEEYCVVSVEFENPEHPHEQEVSLRAHDCKEIPIQVVVDKIEVKCT